MLTFNHAQMRQLQRHSLVGQLGSQAATLQAAIKTEYPDFYARQGDGQVLDYILWQIPLLVDMGYQEQGQVQQFLLLQCRWQQELHNIPALHGLCRAHWMAADDRLDALACCKAQPELLPTGDKLSLYQPLDAAMGQALQQAITSQARQCATADANPAVLLRLNLLRHALFHSMLAHYLANIPGWQAWHSQWRRGEFSVQHPAHQRGLRLRPLDSDKGTPNLGLSADFGHQDGLPVLDIRLPDTPGFGGGLRQLEGWLDAWMQDLLPVEAMRQYLQPPTATPPSGANHA